MTDAQSKEDCLDKGKKAEKKFLKDHPELGWEFNPDEFMPDFIYHHPDGRIIKIDLKTQETQWYAAVRLFRICPTENAFTACNTGPIESGRYTEDTWLLLQATWKPFKGRFFRVKVGRLLDGSIRVRINNYKFRQNADPNCPGYTFADGQRRRHNTEGLVIDLLDVEEITEAITTGRGLDLVW